MRVLVLSAYNASSHNRWHQNLVRALDDFEWTVLTLPPRYFRWRIRANSLHWALECREQLTQPYDVILATSMTDITGLRSLLPELAAIPTIVYFHENQFVYPVTRQQHSLLEPQMMTLYSALSADRVVFNSGFNRETFLAGVAQLLGKMPDFVPTKTHTLLEARSSVLPVPLEDDCYPAKLPSQSASHRLQVIWNHRWEYDKNPALLLAALELLARQHQGRLPFDMHLTGQQFRQQPEVFEQIKALLTRAGALGQWGFVETLADYRALLQRCDLVLSTADHDFQGLSVLEAVAAGCIPLLPNHQVYPEWFDARWCYPVSGDIERDAATLAAALDKYCQQHAQANLPAAPDVTGFSLSQLAGDYRQLLQEVSLIQR